jgi:nucleoside-diphosphate-sugar epimerase
MHVFVTGATGFIGFHTVMALHAAGHTVRLGVRSPEKMRKLYAPYDVDISDYAVGEITDPVAIDKALDNCDAVVHTAAMVSLDANKEAIMRHTNLTGTQLVIGGAVKKGIKSIVYVSSVAAIFDRHAKVLNEDTPLVEPTSAYAKSKLECELYVRSLIKEGASIAITYPSAVIGPNDPAMSEGNQGLAFILKLCFVNTTTGQQIIDVRELASAQVKLLEQKKSGRFLVTGHYVPWRELGLVLDNVTGKKMLKVPLPRWVLRITGSLVDLIGKVHKLEIPITREAVTFATEWVYADDTKIRKELGITYRPLEDTMRDTIKWLATDKHIPAKWVDNIK